MQAFHHEIEKTQQELLTVASLINDNNGFSRFIDLFQQKTQQFSDDAKLDLLFQACTICPGFPGNKPPYLEKTDYIALAKRLLNYKKINKLDRKIVLLSFGISDGARIYETILFAKILGVDIHLIGIDYSNEYLNQSKLLFPNEEFINLDLLKLTKSNSLYQRLKEKVDFIDLSFLLHEIYSFGGAGGETGTINDREGKKKVRQLIQTCYELLTKRGEIFIKDGYILSDANDYEFVNFSDLYRNAYDQLVEKYRPVKFPNLNSEHNEIKLTRQQLALALDKITFFLRIRRRNVDAERIAREMKEQLCYYSNLEYRKLLKSIGFNIVYLRRFNQEVYEAHQRKHVKIIKGKKELPRPYMTIIGVKK